MSPELCDMLAAHIASNLSSLPGGNPVEQDQLVFTNSAGGAVHQVAWLRTHFKPAVTRALPAYAASPTDPERQTLRFHDLRHTYVSFLINAGVHAKSIQEQAGHASAVITLDRYGHLLPAAADRVRAALSDIFAQGTRAHNVTPLRAAS